ncbi:hypothetical protein Syun_012452 [Stephania yunnanensis]|uniref:Aspartate/glutamate/uridylate kinase domain-containing protein n=1 Tax=Stephania yunnanensis TaxID=152371 RepID=A0AAP0JZK1_9MAGN
MGGKTSKGRNIGDMRFGVRDRNQKRKERDPWRVASKSEPHCSEFVSMRYSGAIHGVRIACNSACVSPLNNYMNDARAGANLGGYLGKMPMMHFYEKNKTGEEAKNDSSGIFWDNDSLAALLALELNADLLILLSDVEGLYSGPPSDPQSKLIDTYIKQKHQGEITFGGKSRVGRGGLTAKVKVAINAAYASIPVVITRYDSSLLNGYGWSYIHYLHN